MACWRSEYNDGARTRRWGTGLRRSARHRLAGLRYGSGLRPSPPLQPANRWNAPPLLSCTLTREIGAGHLPMLTLMNADPIEIRRRADSGPVPVPDPELRPAQPRGLARPPVVLSMIDCRSQPPMSRLSDRYAASTSPRNPITEFCIATVLQAYGPQSRALGRPGLRRGCRGRDAARSLYSTRSADVSFPFQPFHR